MKWSEDFYKNFKVRKLVDGESILVFDCGDEDLNEFAKVDAPFYKSELIAMPYVFYPNEEENKIIAYFTLSNDKISVSEFQSNSQFNKFRKHNFNDRKRLRSYPSVKIGRLAVSLDYEGQGIGSFLLKFIKSYFLEDNKTGCRFITVDAYRKAIPFYEANGFEFLQKDEGGETELMYYDLKTTYRDID